MSDKPVFVDSVYIKCSEDSNGNQRIQIDIDVDEFTYVLAGLKDGYGKAHFVATQKMKNSKSGLTHNVLVRTFKPKE